MDLCRDCQTSNVRNQALGLVVICKTNHVLAAAGGEVGLTWLVNSEVNMVSWSHTEKVRKARSLSLAEFVTHESRRLLEMKKISLFGSIPKPFSKSLEYFLGFSKERYCPVSDVVHEALCSQILPSKLSI